MPTLVKICGLKSEVALEAALASGADYVGFVFFPPSPRNLSLEVAEALAERARGRAKIVTLMVDPDDALIGAIADAVAPDLLQLHGKESPERAAELKARWGIPVMKAIPVESAEDARAAVRYREVADLVLFDARAIAAGPGAVGRRADRRRLLGRGEPPRREGP